MALRDYVWAAAVGAVVSTVAVRGTAAEINPEGWPVPDTRTAIHIGVVRKDIISEIPGPETSVGVYRAEDGTYFNTLTARGHHFGFYVDTDGKPPMEYQLLDLDGDGRFAIKLETDEKGPTPGYLLKAR